MRGEMSPNKDNYMGKYSKAMVLLDYILLKRPWL